MGNVFTKNGNLTPSIGEGYLSAHELSILKPGDTVVMAKFAGEGYSVFSNGSFVFTGEIVILIRTFGVRVTSLLPPKAGAEVPENSDDAVEMLPFMIELGEISITLSQLKGVGPGTIVGLGTPFSEDEDAKLIVAGIPVARGKVGATYENMSLRITQIEESDNDMEELEVRSSGNLLEKDYITQFPKDYNFKRPDELNQPAPRIVRFIATHAERRDDGSAYLEITQDELAQSVGVTRETVNKHLQGLQADDLIRIGRGRIDIPNYRILDERGVF